MDKDKTYNNVNVTHELYFVSFEQISKDIEEGFLTLLFPVHLKNVDIHYWCPFCKEVFRKNAATRKDVDGNVGHIKSCHGTVSKVVAQRFRGQLKDITMSYYMYIQYKCIQFIQEDNTTLRTKGAKKTIDDNFVFGYILTGHHNELEDCNEVVDQIRDLIFNLTIDLYHSDLLGTSVDKDIRARQVQSRVNIVASIEDDSHGTVDNGQQQTVNVQHPTPDEQQETEEATEEVRYIDDLLSTQEEDDNYCILVEQLTQVLIKADDGIEKVASFIEENYSGDNEVSKIINYISSEAFNSVNIPLIVNDVVFKVMKFILRISRSTLKLHLSYNASKQRWLRITNASRRRLQKASEECTSFSLSTDLTSTRSVHYSGLFARFTVKNNFWDQLVNVTIIDGSKDADAIVKYIKDSLTDAKVDIKKCIGITTDGDPAMAGKYSGVGKKLTDDLKLSRFDPHNHMIDNEVCMDHRMNLAGKSIKEVDEIKEVMVLFSWFSSGPIISIFNEYRKRKNLPHVPYPSNTRWCYDSDTIKYLKVHLKSIIEFLDEYPAAKRDFNEQYKKAMGGNANGYFDISQKEFEALLIGLSVFYSECKTMIKIIEAKNSFFPDCYMMVLKHMSSIFNWVDYLKKQPAEEVFNGNKEINQYFQLCNANEQIITAEKRMILNNKLVRVYTQYLNVMKVKFVCVTGMNQPPIENVENWTFSQFMNHVYSMNKTSELFQLMVLFHRDFYSIYGPVYFTHREYEREYIEVMNSIPSDRKHENFYTLINEVFANRTSILLNDMNALLALFSSSAVVESLFSKVKYLMNTNMSMITLNTKLYAHTNIRSGGLQTINYVPKDLYQRYLKKKEEHALQRIRINLPL